MYIVTPQAFAFLEEFVIGSAVNGLHQFSMAFAAQLRVVGGNRQKIIFFSAMGPVALKAFAFQHRFMCVGFHEFWLGFKMAAIADRIRIGL